MHYGDVIRARTTAPHTDLRIYLSAVPQPGDYSLRDEEGRNVAAVHVHAFPQQPNESLNPAARDRNYRYRATLLTAATRPTQAIATTHFSWVPEPGHYSLRADGKEEMTVLFSTDFSFAQ